MYNTITEIKDTLEGINHRITETEQLNQLEDRMMEITAWNRKNERKKKMNRKEDNLTDLWDNIKHANTLIIGVLKR